MARWNTAIRVSRNTKVFRANDVDYFSSHVRYSQTEYLTIGGGPTWSNGFPRPEVLKASVEVFERELHLPGLSDPEQPSIDGVDVRGSYAGGKRWRFTGHAFQTFDYDGVSPKAATFFDSIIDTLCWVRKAK